jgi:hypothetical protein
MFRLALQPVWVRFLVEAPLLAVFWCASIRPTPSLGTAGIWGTAVSAAFVGVTVAGWFALQRQPRRMALVDAAAGVDKTTRSQAIAAITHGVVPADPTVRSVAIRLGSAYLGGKSAVQLKRQERQTWIILTVIAVSGTAVAVMESSTRARLCLLAVISVGVVVLPLRLLRTRRIQRNVARFSEGSAPPAA